MHFWEIIKLQFEKERHTLLCIIFKAFYKYYSWIIFEKCVGLTAEYPAILKLHLWKGWIRGYAVESTTPTQVNF